MSLPAIFDNFVQQSPVTVMMRGILERVMSPEKLDELFEKTAQQQYTRELLFSEVVELMMPVVTGRRPSVHASYQAREEQLVVSSTSVYNKINGIEPNVSAELIRHSAAQLQPVLKQLGGTKSELVPGYRVKICDGNALSGTEHRLVVLRDTSAGPLPGKSLVVLDPVKMLAIDLFPCEDGHAQERSLFKAVLNTVEANDLWIADRNFCVLSVLWILLANLTHLTGDKADGRWQMAEGRDKEKGEKLNSSCLHTSAASCLLPPASCLQQCSSSFIKLTNSIYYGR